LTEGLATILEQNLIETLYPEWNVRHLFNLRIQTALAEDSKQSTHAMTVSESEVDSTEEVSNAIDYVTKEKCEQNYCSLKSDF